MTYEELSLLRAHFGEEKEYIGDGYYRLRQKDQRHYELAYLRPDSCGTTTVSPQITLEVVGETVKASSLLDFYQTPVRKLVASPETAVELEQALTALVAKFKEAKGLMAR